MVGYKTKLFSAAAQCGLKYVEILVKMHTFVGRARLFFPDLCLSV